jgi:hypothetical protein
MMYIGKGKRKVSSATIMVSTLFMKHLLCILYIFESKKDRFENKDESKE